MSGDARSARDAVSLALHLRQQYPLLPPLEVLDRAMGDHLGKDLDFDAPDEPGGDATDPRHPFGQLVAAALDSAVLTKLYSLATDCDSDLGDALEAHWYADTMVRFQERYRLWDPLGCLPSGVALRGAQALLMSHRPSTIRRMEPDTDDNGILTRVPSHFLAIASRQLPPPEGAGDEPQAVTIEADWAGLVRITFQRQKMRHHRNSHWAWVAIRADRA
jgi:hypothetical protein